MVDQINEISQWTYIAPVRQCSVYRHGAGDFSDEASAGSSVQHSVDIFRSDRVPWQERKTVWDCRGNN